MSNHHKGQPQKLVFVFVAYLRNVTANSASPAGFTKALPFHPGLDAAHHGQQTILDLLVQGLADGGKADIAKPLKGLGSGVMEIALPYRGNAFRVVYAVQIGAELWVVHAFKKKSTQGIKTPKHEIDLVVERVKRLKEMLR